MATLTVGSGQQFSTLAAAIAASHSGDTIDVQAGTYYNDFATISHALTIVGVGGYAHFVDTQLIPNGKANLIVDANLTIQNLEFSGAQDSNHNGAGIRWEAGNLTVLNSYFHDNEEGILAADNPTGRAVINNSAFVHNGDGFDDQAHGVYLGHVASLSADNDYFSNQNGGSDLKSRAAQNTITNSIFVDLVNGTTNYVIDLPEGGTDVVQNSYIQQSGTPGNSNIIHFGGEIANPQGSLLVSGNTIASYYSSATAVLDQSSQLATITGNNFFHIAQIESGGPASISGNTTLSTQPTAPTWNGGATTSSPVSPPPPPPPPVSPPPPPPPPPVSPPPPPPPSSGTIHGTGWVYGTSGNDSIVGDSGLDSLVGNGGSDTFSGGLYVLGTGGHDVIYVTDSATFISEPANDATVFSSVSFSAYDGSWNDVRNLTFTGSANVTGTGTWGNDKLVANNGNDSLVGNGGSDTFVVGGGNDTMVGSYHADLVVFNDTYASHHFSGTSSNLTVTGTHTHLLIDVDTLQFSDQTITTAQALAGTSPPPPPLSPPPPPPPSGAIHGTGWVYGTSGNDSIVGDSGHDSLVGNGGNDTFSGGLFVQGFGGQDMIKVTNTATFIDEPNANGATVKSSVSFSLFDGSYNNVHKLTFTGSAAVTGTGTWGKDVLTANGGGDTFDGLGGADTLAGGAGHDTFRFQSLAYQNSVVQNFVHGQDVLDIHGVLTQVGSTGNPIAHHVLNLVQSGADTHVMIDDHSGTPKLLATLQGIQASTLTAADFHY